MKKPMLKEVGNLLRTKVPRTPMTTCINPVHTAANMRARDPSCDLKLSTAARKGVVRGVGLRWRGERETETQPQRSFFVTATDRLTFHYTHDHEQDNKN